MTDKVFTINKANVFTEVAKTTSFLGIKKSPDGSLYEQIFTTDDDRQMLERFWNESANVLTQLFKSFIVSVSPTTQAHGIDLSANYTVVLSLPSSYDDSLDGSISSSMFSFVVNYIVSKWLKFLDKDEAALYGQESLSMLEDIKSKIFFRKKPTRTNPKIL